MILYLYSIYCFALHGSRIQRRALKAVPMLARFSRAVLAEFKPMFAGPGVFVQVGCARDNDVV